MDVISIVMLSLGAIAVLFGFLYGRKRGLLKAIVRLILVVLAAAGAFFLREMVTSTILNTPFIEGETVISYLTKTLTEGENGQQMAGLVGVLETVLTMVLQIVVFILLFVVLRIASIVVYWIIASIITSAKKARLRKTIEQDVLSLGEKRKLNKRQKSLVNYVKHDQDKVSNNDFANRKEEKRIRRRLNKNEKELIKNFISFCFIIWYCFMWTTTN